MRRKKTQAPVWGHFLHGGPSYSNEGGRLVFEGGCFPALEVRCGPIGRPLSRHVSRATSLHEARAKRRSSAIARWFFSHPFVVVGQQFYFKNNDNYATYRIARLLNIVQFCSSCNFERRCTSCNVVNSMLRFEQQGLVPRKRFQAGTPFFLEV